MAKLKYLHTTSIYLLLTLVLTGCMHTAPQTLVDKQIRLQYLQNMRYWHAHGKVTISNAKQNINASFTWEQKQDRYNIHFYSPFSTETATINGIGKQFTVTTNNIQDGENLEPEQNLPFAQLTAWLKGLTYANASIQIARYNANAQLQMLQQDGWLIEYPEYTVCQRIALPEKIIISNGQIKAKLLIKGWRF